MILPDPAPLDTPARRWAGVNLMLTALAALAVVVLPWVLTEDPVIAGAAAVGGLCLVLWLGELVPPYVPTFVLWALTPLALGSFGEQFGLRQVLGWSAEPVLALFLGGFALSAAASRYGIDSWVAGLAVRLSRGRRLALLALAILATATLSMWISNIAAAAMKIAALHPLFAGMPLDDRFRRALLIGIAVGANFGGIATPIGTGPNAIAIAALAAQEPSYPITFLSWMAFALPLALGLSAAGFVLLALRFRVAGTASLPELPARPPSGRARWVVLVFAAAVAAWLTEPLHGASSALVALLATAVLFGSGLLERRDLARIDWSTLLLIAGGIGLGNLFEQSGVVSAAASLIPWAEMPGLFRILLLCLASALLSALMSNTATATLLIPLAASLDPSPAIAVLIAVAASLGTPFAISTPPNAMVYGEGGITSRDLWFPG